MILITDFADLADFADEFGPGVRG